MDDAIYLIYNPDDEGPFAFVWYTDDSWWSGWTRTFIEQNDAVWDCNEIGELTIETVFDNIGENYSRLSWPSCAECGAVSYLDFLCSECRSDSVNLTVE